MNYQIGDMLRYLCKTGKHAGEYAICIITKKSSARYYEVVWIVEKEHIRNTPAYQLWSNSFLDRDFERLS